MPRGKMQTICGVLRKNKIERKMKQGKWIWIIYDGN